MLKNALQNKRNFHQQLTRNKANAETDSILLKYL